MSWYEEEVEYGNDFMYFVDGMHVVHEEGMCHTIYIDRRNIQQIDPNEFLREYQYLSKRIQEVMTIQDYCYIKVQDLYPNMDAH